MGKVNLRPQVEFIPLEDLKFQEYKQAKTHGTMGEIHGTANKDLVDTVELVWQERNVYGRLLQLRTLHRAGGHPLWLTAQARLPMSRG